jgi:3,5-epimerase/4-reductase
MSMYRDIVEPSFTWKNFSIEEQDKILSSKRSNNLLNTNKLTSTYKVDSIDIAIRKVLINMKKLKK